MKKTFLSLVAAVSLYAAAPPFMPYGIIDNTGNIVHDSLNANGIGDSATRTINAKAFIGLAARTTFTCIGNSYCNFNIPTWFDSAAVRWNFTSINYGAPGARVEDENIMGVALAENPQYYDKYALEVTTNDLTGHVATVDFIRAYTAIPYFLAVSADRKMPWDSATYSGSWTTDTLYGRSFRRSSTSGNYAQFTCIGKWCIVGNLFSTTGGDVAISVNGVPYTTFDGLMTSSMAPITETFSALRLGPFETDTNTIRITNNENGTNTYFSWYYGIERDEVISGPRILSHGCIPVPAFDSLSLVLCDEYSDAMDSLHQEVREAGIPIQWKNTIVFPEGSFSADTLHLSEAGAGYMVDTMSTLFFDGTVQQAIDQMTAIPGAVNDGVIDFGNGNIIDGSGSGLRFLASDDTVFGITAAAVQVFGQEGANAELILYADDGDEATDIWKIVSKTTTAWALQAGTLSGYVDALQVTPTALQFFAQEGNPAEFIMYADDGDDPADIWKISANTNGTWSLLTGTTGSYTDALGMTATTFQVFGQEGAASEITMYADNGDDAADQWKLTAKASGTWALQSGATGSWLDVIGATVSATQIFGQEGADAILIMYADEGDDNADIWTAKAKTDGTWALQSRSTGVDTDVLSITGGGIVTSPGFDVDTAPVSGAGTMTFGTAAPCASGAVQWITFYNQGTAGAIPWCVVP